MKKEVEKRKSFRNFTILLISFIFISMLVISFIPAQDSSDLKKKTEDALKDIQTKGDNYKYSDFKLLDSAVKQKIVQEHLKEIMPMLKSSGVLEREELYKNNGDDLAKGFNSDKFGAEMRAELFYDKDTEKKLILDNSIRNKLWQSVNSDTMRSRLLKDSINRAYKTGNYEGSPELKSVNLKNSDKIKWDGLKIIGEKGGFQNLDNTNSDPSKPSDSPHPSMTSFSYENGKIKEVFSTGREIDFENGNLLWRKEVYDKATGATGRLIYYAGKDGKIVGETRGLGLGFGAVDSSKGETSLIDISYNAKGDVDFKMSGKPEDTYISLKDQFGNRYHIGMSDKVDSNGKPTEGILEVRKIKSGFLDSSEEFLAISGNTKASTFGLGEIKARGNTPVVLGGSYFDNPGAGAIKIDDRIKTEGEGKASKLNVAGKALLGLGTGVLSGNANDVSAGFSQGKSEETAKALQRLIDRTSPAVREGESYAGVNYFWDTLSKQAMDAAKQNINLPYIEYSMGGKSVELDVTNAYTKVNRIYASSTSSIAGEDLVLKDGPSYVTFRQDKTFINSVNIDSSTNFVGLQTAVGIDRIVNEKSKDSWKIQENGYGGYDFFNSGVVGDSVVKEIDTADVRKRGRNVGVVEVAEVSADNPPKDTSAYPGDYKDTIVEIAVIGERIEGTGIGMSGGRVEQMVNSKAGETTISTLTVAGEFADGVIQTLGEAIQSSGGVENFQKQIDSLKQLEGKTTAEKEKILPGYSNMLADVGYVWNNPGKVDETFNAVKEAGEISKGVPLKLTMDNGAYLGNQPITGTDPTVIRLIASGVVTKDYEYKDLGFRKNAEAMAISKENTYSQKFSSGQLSFTNFQNGLREQAKQAKVQKTN